MRMKDLRNTKNMYSRSDKKDVSTLGFNFKFHGVGAKSIKREQNLELIFT